MEVESCLCAEGEATVARQYLFDIPVATGKRSVEGARERAVVSTENR